MHNFTFFKQFSAIYAKKDDFFGKSLILAGFRGCIQVVFAEMFPGDVVV